MKKPNLRVALLAILLFLFSSLASAELNQAYAGFPEAIIIVLIVAALAFTILGFILEERWYVMLLGAIFWFINSFAINKIIYRTSDGTKITYMDAYLLTYVFGFIGVLCVLRVIISIFNNIDSTRVDVSDLEAV
jgi:ABC-type uncharacterized transport system permease subunit